MRKLLVFTFCILSCLLVGCNKTKNPPDDQVKTIEVCSEFKNLNIYQTDIVNLNDYFITVTYDSGKTESVNLSQFGSNILNTSKLGENELGCVYKNKAFIIKYVVLEVLPISAMFKDSALIFYRGENYNFSNKVVSVLFNNGEERNVSLNEFSIENINYELSNDVKYVVASYNGVSVNIPYKVTNRPIIENVDYNFNDTLNIYNDMIVKIRFFNDKVIMFNDDSENREVLLNQDVNICDFNRVWTIAVINNKLEKVCFYLIDDTVYCEILEE